MYCIWIPYTKLWKVGEINGMGCFLVIINAELRKCSMLRCTNSKIVNLYEIFELKYMRMWYIVQRFVCKAFFFFLKSLTHGIEHLTRLDLGPLCYEEHFRFICILYGLPFSNFFFRPHGFNIWSLQNLCRFMSLDHFFIDVDVCDHCLVEKCIYNEILTSRGNKV